MKKWNLLTGIINAEYVESIGLQIYFESVQLILSDNERKLLFNQKVVNSVDRVSVTWLRPKK